MKNYYQILGVNEKATQKEIKSAYKALMKKYHPDVYRGNEKIAAEINNAYDVLSNPKTREEYDLEIHNTQTYNTQGSTYNQKQTAHNSTNTNKTNAYSQYRKESAQDIYSRILKNKRYQNEDYSNSYSYRTIKNANNYVENKLISLTYFQLMLVVLVIIGICIVGLAFSILDINNISKLKKSRNNTVDTSITTQDTVTRYYPPYNELDNNNTTTSNSASLSAIMEEYGFDIYFDTLQEFMMFIYSEENQDLYLAFIGKQISQEEYLQELLMRAENNYR